MGSRVV
jgi:hypothetical protein